MTKKRMQKNSSPRTQAIHGKTLSGAWEFEHHLVPPLTASTTFRLGSLKRGAQGFIDFAHGKGKNHPILIYDRLEEPTTLMLEEQLSSMEQAESAISFGSGMGAISAALLCCLRAGQKVLAHRTLYGCSFSLLTNWLPRYHLESDLFNLNTRELEIKIKNPKVRVIYFETVANPSLEIIDIHRIRRLVEKENSKRKKEDKIFIIVDNTFATPWGMRPMKEGADFVIQSLTKNISGFGTEMGGAIMTNKEWDLPLKMIRKDFGAVINPYSAWHILVYGLPTQALRFEKQQESAQKIAQFLERHSKIAMVSYPGLKSHPQYRLAKQLLRTPEGKFAPGFMLNFRLKGSMKVCERFVNDLARNSYAITLAVSLGLIKTLIEVPGYMTHSAVPTDAKQDVGFDPRDIRLSVGIESAEDIIKDLTTALKRL